MDQNSLTQFNNQLEVMRNLTVHSQEGVTEILSSIINIANLKTGPYISIYYYKYYLLSVKHVFSATKKCTAPSSGQNQCMSIATVYN